ncbi:MAG: hypothetical protein ACW98D_14390 [Promethearchaeota archaeon]|jgi:hypothetical protein
MFEEIPFILGFMMFSVIISYIAFKYTSPPLSNIVQALAMVGIVIHEICHYVMCIITRSPIEKVTLIKKFNFKEEQRLGYYGEVEVQAQRISFLQAVLIGLAPLYLSFWLFFSLLEILLYSFVEPIVFAFSIFIMTSIALSAAPSFADFSMIAKVFLNNFNHSIYQILLIILSLLLTFTIISVFNLQGFHEFFVYLIVTGFYFIFKYGFRISVLLLYKNRFISKDLSNRGNFRRYSRRRHNPEKKRHSYYYTP